MRKSVFSILRTLVGPYSKPLLKATITQVGAPTIFWTLSCAEFHWPEFHNLFNDISELTDSQRRENVINNPHLLDWFFTERVEKFVKHWLILLVLHGICSYMNMLFRGIPYTVMVW